MTKHTVETINELSSTLDAPAYPIADVSRLVGITRGRVKRWLRGYDYKYAVGNEMRAGHKESLVHHTEENNVTYASFLDLIDLLFVKQFLERGFTLQFLRNALEEAREHLGSNHFARSKFFTSGKQIILELPKQSKHMIALLTGGQSAIPEIIEQLSDKIDFEDVTGLGLAKKWYPEGKDGLIVIDPLVSFGRPTIVGRGVATENIYDLFLGENSRIDPVSNWFNIPTREIEAAVQFEHSLSV